MPGNAYSPPVYCNEVKKLIPFENQETAESWLRESGLDINGTPLLIPFKNKLGRVEFLKPGDLQDNLRIMGAANYVKPQRWFARPFNWLKKQFKRDFAPHVNNLKGSSIQLAKHGFIVIYERGNKSAGHAFAQLFRKEKEDLKNQIKVTQTNDGPRLNPAKFIQDLSQLALDLEIIAGMNYFIIEDEKGKQMVYRHTFKEGAANLKIAPYLAEEEKRHQSQSVRVHNNKIVERHVLSFIKDLLKWGCFAVGISIIGGGILTIFTSTVIAGPVALLAFVGLSFFAIYKASKDNQSTIKFGEPEFAEFKPELSILKQIKADLMMVRDCLYRFEVKLFNKQSKIFEYDNGTSDLPKSQPPPIAQPVVPSVINPHEIPERVLASIKLERPSTIGVEPESTVGCFPFNFLFFKRNSRIVEDKTHTKAVYSKDFTPQNCVPSAG